ncbi:hypothetical protein AVEN_54554-1 [Araneus ventricosus]|uniref:Uncharacterized protein n=1 Tax=Araneus ventricosus TaxID=182803 RepID=A0A4Y2BKZ9_ARAVE|nr:hypothetical protein AVEN_54554-1 [Araneus ventricosus]
MTSRHDFIGHCGPRIIAAITSGSCDDPIVPGYDPSSEMGPKSHTTITAYTKEARACLLIRQLLIRELRRAKSLMRLDLVALRPRVVVLFLMLGTGDLSNGETVFEVPGEHFGVQQPHQLALKGCPYLHQPNLRKMAAITCNQKACVTKGVLLKVA